MSLSSEIKAALLGMALDEISIREGYVLLLFDEELNLLHVSVPSGKGSDAPINLLAQAARRAARTLVRTGGGVREEELVIKGTASRLVCYGLRDGQAFRGMLTVARLTSPAIDGERRGQSWQPSYSLADIAGRSPAIRRLREQVLSVSRTDSTVLIMGESGTGKELVAHALHSASQRQNRPFVRVECSSIPRELLESELFGHEPGAFTGASRVAKPGKFELAQGGSIFLDEIGDMPLEMQAKLLRVLQEKELIRVGGIKPIKLDFRVITATRRDLEEMVRTGGFRDDLFYRLDVVRITVPPLREHPEDLAVLCEDILDRMTDRYRLPKIGVEPEVLSILQRYHWPGNVRELMNVLEKVLVSHSPEVISSDHLPDFLRLLRASTGRTPLSLRHTIRDTEARSILEAIRLAGGNKGKAAKLLGIHRSVLYRRMNALGLQPIAPPSQSSKY